MSRLIGGAVSAAIFAAAVAASPAYADPINIVGQQAGTPTQNCGSGNSSLFIGAPGANVTQFTFDSVFSFTPPSCTSTNGPSNFFKNLGVMPSQTYGNLTFSGAGAAVVIGTSSGQAATPWGDSTPYLSVPIPGTTGGNETVAINPSLHDNYFGVYWGSIDTANTITFTLSNGLSYAITGADLTGDTLSEDSVNQVTTATNEYVDFETSPGLFIDSVEFSDGDAIAFEFDNLAFGTIGGPITSGSSPVPEPASLTLFGAALVGAWTLRRRKRA